MVADRLMSRRFGAFAAAAALAGCAAQPAGRVQHVHVPVPVACRESEPPRPAIPTEALAADVTLDAFVAAAIAEIERREGYEVQLRAALAACTRELER